MTTLCRCDWIDNRPDSLERQAQANSEAMPERLQPASIKEEVPRNQDTRSLLLGQATTPFISEYAA